jgi:hypothetical protein
MREKLLRSLNKHLINLKNYNYLAFPIQLTGNVWGLIIVDVGLYKFTIINPSNDKSILNYFETIRTFLQYYFDK